MDELASWNSEALAKVLSNLGYSGFGQLLGGPRDNPAVVLLAALSSRDIEVRVIERLPWLAVEYYDIDWAWLTREAKLRYAENRLGFIVTPGRRIAVS